MEVDRLYISIKFKPNPATLQNILSYIESLGKPRKHGPLPKRRYELLALIVDWKETYDGCTPAKRELMHWMGLGKKSIYSIQAHIKSLEEEGLLTIDPLTGEMLVKDGKWQAPKWATERFAAPKWHDEESEVDYNGSD